MPNNNNHMMISQILKDIQYKEASGIENMASGVSKTNDNSGYVSVVEFSNNKNVLCDKSNAKSAQLESQ
jgi:hypothetical protein